MMFVARSDRTMSKARPVADTGICLRREIQAVRVPLKTLAPGYVPPKAAEPPAPPPRPRRLPERPLAIIGQIAAEHDVSVKMILSRCLLPRVVAARQAAMAAVHLSQKPDGTFRSIPETARLFGRDHTTVLHALRKLRVDTARR